jgi:hypothetical protein
MAEVKNSFLSSKMNKDLDDRLIPSNEYRDALNISVGKAEASDVGVLQSVLGNEFAGFTGNRTVTCIGNVVDEVNDRIFLFLTNYNDPNPALITTVPDPFLTTLSMPGVLGQTTLTLTNTNVDVIVGQTVRITPYNVTNPIEQVYVITNISGNVITLNNPLLSNIPSDTIISIEYSMSVVCFSTTSLTAQTLVSGIFLNFAKNTEFNIYGVNLIENLLFWTDNRNQPRKINVNTALNSGTFYNNESQISVAKYYPLLPITLFNKVTINSTNTSSTLNGYTTFTTTIADANLLKVGYQLISDTIEIGDYIVVNDIIYDTTFATIVLTSLTSSPSITPIDDLIFYGTTMSDASDDPNWTGDTAFMQDKYIRFSYRYKFQDGEYSLMAPFTQIVFIPNQKGFFYSGDETRAYTSTIVEWMQNYVNNILLHIELPQLATKINSEYLIEKIDILYRESDALTVKVLETIGINDIISNSVGNVYTYEYKSQTPYKTLPEAQITRVFDKVPIRARAQESAGNRIMYGNFIASNTAPASINYTVSYGEKNKQFDNWIEYPNHNVKQNRSYQVGVILADKFGRQSPVILSSFNKNSSIYVPFSQNTTSVKNWPGGVLNITFNNVITSSRSESTGEPGLYATINGIIPDSSDGFQVDTVTIYDAPGYSSASYNNAITFTLTAPTTDPKNIPVLGGYLRGEFDDYVQIIKNPSTNTYICDGTISSNYNKKPIPKDIKYSYSINPLGWYSYKVVVKQQQQEYYNVYLPGMLNGYPAYQTSGPLGNTPSIFPTNEINRIAHTVLINDNINKVPRDLSEVGPDQKQYRSSVNMFCRVENVGTGSIDSPYNVQYFPSTKADVVSTIATSNELNFLPTDTDTNLHGTASQNFYQLETRPSIARISTVSAVGTTAVPEIPIGSYPNIMVPKLGVYETAPTTSLLEIFWETTTAGYLSDLNEDILLGNDTVDGLSPLVFSFNEAQDPNGSGTVIGAENSPYITDYFWPLSNGLPIDDSFVTMEVFDLSGTDVTTNFVLEVFNPVLPLTYRRYRIKIATTPPGQPFVFTKEYATKAFFNFKFNITDNSTTNQFVAIKNNVAMTNVAPEITYPADNSTEIQLAVNNPGGNIIQMLGNNGSNSSSTVDTHWSIINVIPSTGTEYFTILDPTTGIISAAIDTANCYELTVRLIDAYNYSLGAPTPGSLSTTRTLNVCADNIIDFTTQASSSLTSSFQGYFVGDQGIIDTWQSFLPGETVLSYNITCDGYNTPGQSDLFPAINLAFNYIPDTNPGYDQGFKFSYQFTHSTFPLPAGDPRAQPSTRVVFRGTITTNLGRVINLKTDNSPYGISPFINIFLVNGDNVSRFVNFAPGYRPSTNSSFLITNNSTDQSWWQALERNGNAVVGGQIAPGQTITTVGSQGETCIRTQTIHTELNVTPPFTITYGSSCP